MATIGQISRRASKAASVTQATRLRTRKRSTRACMSESMSSADPSQPSASGQSIGADRSPGSGRWGPTPLGPGTPLCESGSVLTTSVLPTRTETIERARARGWSVVAALPYHLPRALLRAHRCHAVEVWAPVSVPSDGGARHFQAYTCAIVVRGTAFLVEQGIDRVDALLVPHGCDALQGMGSVLADFVRPPIPVLTLYPPRSRREVDRDYLVAELRALGTRLAEVTGHRPDEADWGEALAAEESADSALADLYSRRGQVALTDRDFYAVVRAREYLIAEDFVGLARSLPVGEPARPGVGLMLSGILVEPMEVLDRINDIGAHVAADDLSCGWRRVLPPSALSDPYERLADRFLGGPPDPTRGDPVQARADSLVDRCRSAGARGVLVYDLKFCEPELFYVPLLRERLVAAGLPVLHIEFEVGGVLPSQTMTRIEALVETLS